MFVMPLVLESLIFILLLILKEIQSNYIKEMQKSSGVARSGVLRHLFNRNFIKIEIINYAFETTYQIFLPIDLFVTFKAFIAEASMQHALKKLRMLRIFSRYYTSIALHKSFLTLIRFYS
ncbi:hypothetical protein BpHYR1_033685 [Brachionus plicatilis]|uniref:Uncharacterized protein n=1 Tax=Brachionus plicatilis TaxID=10195 RepID=A0A3M7Q8A0_BRAPC|nr:hypothetical protein BpHYR1_033685 [Brachionus plicatilis]